jgi:hypothetical protein
MLELKIKAFQLPFQALFKNYSLFDSNRKDLFKLHISKSNLKSFASVQSKMYQVLKHALLPVHGLQNRQFLWFCRFVKNRSVGITKIKI